MPSALILLADGTEEMEFVISYDTLVRGGVKVTSAFVPEPSAVSSVNPPSAKGSRGINIVPDVYFDLSASHGYDALIIPGGAKGAETMSKTVHVQQLVKEYIEKEKIVGMICAGTLTAQTAGLPKQPLTSHPSVKDTLEKDFEYSEESVVVSGTLVTSRGPGTAFPFALKLVELLSGSEKRKEIYSPMVFPAGTPF